jgi:hypothetical protein
LNYSFQHKSFTNSSTLCQILKKIELRVFYMHNVVFFIEIVIFIFFHYNEIWYFVKFSSFNFVIHCASLPNHNILGMIWKYYSSFVYFIFEKLLLFYHTQFRFMTFWIKILIASLKNVWNICKKNPISLWEIMFLSKPHYLVTKTQKIICIQLLCNYPLGITTIVQLSP